jgi:Uracil DNA glycosylase superfamily
VAAPSYDPGPPQAFVEKFAALPSYAPFKDHFWADWGPVFYRGRLDGSARVLCIASDPGATERIAGRTLVGDAGQRTQGFLAKLGVTHSYLCLNAYAVALIPSHAAQGEAVLTDPAHLAWRNSLYDMAKGPQLQVIVAFGAEAQKAVSLWPGKGALPVLKIPHPSSHDETVLVTKWAAAITELRGIVTPDPDGDTSLPNYGAKFLESDYRPIPRGDLPFGAPPFLGDDSAGRAAQPPRNTSVSRPSPDDRHTLIWVAPKS